MLAEATIRCYSYPMQMTTKTPAIIYSVIVKTLQSSRVGSRGWVAKLEGEIDEYSFTVILDLCSRAVTDKRDLEDFRGVCEDILEKVLRLRQVLSTSVTRGIHPRFKLKMVKAGLMEREDSCHPEVQDWIALREARKKEKENAGLKS